jgi:hypothetical protein
VAFDVSFFFFFRRLRLLCSQRRLVFFRLDAYFDIRSLVGGCLPVGYGETLKLESLSRSLFGVGVSIALGLL